MVNRHRIVVGGEPPRSTRPELSPRKGSNNGELTPNYPPELSPESFPVQSDEHLLTVLRYIERNAVGPGWSRGRSTGAGGWKQARS